MWGYLTRIGQHPEFDMTITNGKLERFPCIVRNRERIDLKIIDGKRIAVAAEIEFDPGKIFSERLKSTVTHQRGI